MNGHGGFPHWAVSATKPLRITVANFWTTIILCHVHWSNKHAICTSFSGSQRSLITIRDT